MPREYSSPFSSLSPLQNWLNSSKHLPTHLPLSFHHPETSGIFILSVLSYNASTAINRWTNSLSKQTKWIFSAVASAAIRKISALLAPLKTPAKKFNSKQGAKRRQNGSLISSTNIYFRSGRENKGKKFSSNFTKIFTFFHRGRRLTLLLMLAREWNK